MLRAGRRNQHSDFDQQPHARRHLGIIKALLAACDSNRCKPALFAVKLNKLLDKYNTYEGYTGRAAWLILTHGV
jgi:hypothetical protein